MAATAHKYIEEEDERVPLRLIPGGKTTRGRNAEQIAARPRRDARRQDARPFRRVFTASLVACALLVIFGLGPVFLSAQATRDSQQSVLIQESLDAANARSEQLEMRRSVLTSSLRVNTIATTQLGMVPAVDGQMTVELDVPKAQPQTSAHVQTPAPAAPQDALKSPRAAQQYLANKSKAALRSLARLTAGQAGALLVGDVGLAATR